jgi:hypothetical protein
MNDTPTVREALLDGVILMQRIIQDIDDNGGSELNVPTSMLKTWVQRAQNALAADTLVSASSACTCNTSGENDHLCSVHGGGPR